MCITLLVLAKTIPLLLLFFIPGTRYTQRFWYPQRWYRVCHGENNCREHVLEALLVAMETPLVVALRVCYPQPYNVKLPQRSGVTQGCLQVRVREYRTVVTVGALLEALVQDPPESLAVRYRQI